MLRIERWTNGGDQEVKPSLVMVMGSQLGGDCGREDHQVE